MALDEINKVLNGGQPDAGETATDQNPYGVTHVGQGNITPVVDTTPVTPNEKALGDNVIRKDVDNISRGTGYGEFSSIATKAFFGINHRGFGNPIPMNKDQFGLTFFTRPKLNLTHDNISRIRTMTLMASDRPYSVPRAIRAWLDPVGSKPGKNIDSKTISRQGYSSPLVDERNPFITILTNNLLTITGWPDPEVDIYTSKPGLKKEEWSMVDGTYRVLRAFELNCTFKNIQSDPITLLFHIWNMYQSLVYDGTFSPRGEEIIENRIDYQTRIYRLTLDSTRTYVEKIAATGASFPTAAPLGAQFDYASDVPYNVDNDQITIPFQCMGADYLDPISMYEFNEITMMFNPNIRENVRSKYYVKLTPGEKLIFHNEGYPLINLDTNELEIWISKESYNAAMKGV